MMMMMMFSHLTLRYESENPRIFKDSQESLSNVSFMKELLSITFLKDDHSLFTEYRCQPIEIQFKNNTAEEVRDWELVKVDCCLVSGRFRLMTEA